MNPQAKNGTWHLDPGVLDEIVRRVVEVAQLECLTYSLDGSASER